jgi:hypothetical protein
VVKREQLEAGGEIHQQTELESGSEIPNLPELKGKDGKKRKATKPTVNALTVEPTTQPDLTAEPAPVATPQRPERLSGRRKITRPELKRLPAPHLTRGGPSPGPAP